MQYVLLSRWSRAACVAGVIGLLGAVPGSAQAVGGQARAVQATVIGVGTEMLADTGTLGGSTDAREASQNIGSIPSVLEARALHATAIAWPDQAASEASLSNLALSVAGVAIGADFVMARVQTDGDNELSTASVEGLSVGGVPIAVTGAKNQRIDVPGGVLVVNEQRKGPSGTVVNALHLTIDGTADVIIASATVK